MGKSSSRFGSIKLELENYIISSGESIKGSVNITIQKQISPCRLQLIFEGIEEMKYGEEESITLKGKVSSYNLKFDLMSWESPLKPGSYLIPFTYDPPNDVPGSFDHTNFNWFLKISYRVYARLHGDRFEKANYVDIGVINNIPLSRPIEPLVPVTMKWWGEDRGNVYLDIRWINDTFTTGNPIKCLLWVNNSKGKVNVKSIMAEVYADIIKVEQKNTPRYVRVDIFNSKHEFSVPAGQSKDRCFEFTSDLDECKINLMNLFSMKGKLFECKFYVKFTLNKAVICSDLRHFPSIFSLFFVRNDPVYQFPFERSSENCKSIIIGSISFISPNEDIEEKKEIQGIN